ncbi:MAG: hypothetical protein Q9190_004719 [Brigantiaea leucoxantha]
MAEVVFSGVSDEVGVQGTLFQGVRFWLSQKVPQRKSFIENVRANGGEIVPLEKQADVKIVDHARKEAIPGTYSFRYIEESIRNGKRENLDDHAVGPPEGTVRSVGSTTQPARAGRVKFTPEDDQVLWSWISSTENKGVATSGNELYKQLEYKNPRHTWQSWRDRWVKYLKGLPRPAFVSANAPPTPPLERADHGSEVESGVQDKVKFTQEDAEKLLGFADDILKIPPENLDEAWSKWAEAQEVSNERFSAQ